MFFLLPLREKRKTAAPIRARATTPPTTPPAMAPTLLELFFLLLVLSSLPSLPVEGELVAEEDVWLPRLLAEDVVDGKI